MLRNEKNFDLSLNGHFPEAGKYVFVSLTLLTLLFIIYHNSFHVAWHFDDYPNIVENRNVHLKDISLSEIVKFFYFDGRLQTDRPVAYLSFALNYYLHGLNVFGYHVVNFIIHYLTGLFLFLLIYRTLNLPRLRERYGTVSYPVALLAVFFWAISPVHVHAVSTIVQRMASMCGLFYILAMYLYLLARCAPAKKTRVFLFALTAFFALLALGTKENAVLLPFSLLIYDLFFLQGINRESLRKNLKIFLIPLLIMIVFGFIYIDFSPAALFIGFEMRPFTMWERLLTQGRIIVWYISLLFYPASSRLTFIHDIAISTGFFNPWTTLAAWGFIVFSLLAACAIAKKRPLIAFSILFFFLNHALEGSIIPLELIFEHRNYIPSMFLFILPALIIVGSLRFFSRQRALQGLILFLTAFLIFDHGHGTYMRNKLIRHPLTLWLDNVVKSPKLSRPYINLGAVQVELGLPADEAQRMFAKALELDRFHNRQGKAATLYNLGYYELTFTKNYDQAITFFNEAIKVYRDYAHPWGGLALALREQGRLAEADEALREGLQKWPRDFYLNYYRSLFLIAQGAWEEAIRTAMWAQELKPEGTAPLLVIGESHRQMGSRGLARYYLERFLAANHHDPEAHLALLALYADLNLDYDHLARHLLVLKGDQNWSDIYRRKHIFSVLKEETIKALIPLVRSSLARQAR